MHSIAQYRTAGRRTDAGYAMAGMLVAIAVVSVFLSMLMPTWSTWSQREKEAELIFRGEQYARAIELYQRQFAGAYPADVETLVEQRFLRQAYTDPVTGGEFQILTQASLRVAPGQVEPAAERPDNTQRQQFGSVTRADQSTGITGSSPTPFTEAAAGIDEGGGGIIGVVSHSKELSFARYNGRDRYDEWLFVYLPQAARPGITTGAPGRGANVVPGVGGRFGEIGGMASQPGDNAGARGGRGGRDGQRASTGNQQSGVGMPRGDGTGAGGLRTPPRR